MSVEEITLALVAVTLAVAIVGVWYARRGALAAEEENQTFAEVLSQTSKKAEPNVDISDLQVRHHSTGPEGLTFQIEAVITNKSSEPEVVAKVFVAIDDADHTLLGWNARPGLVQTYREAPDHRFALGPGDSQILGYAVGPLLQFRGGGFSGELVAECERAGRKAVVFTYPRTG